MDNTENDPTDVFLRGSPWCAEGFGLNDSAKRKVTLAENLSARCSLRDGLDFETSSLFRWRRTALLQACPCSKLLEEDINSHRAHTVASFSHTVFSH